MLKRPVKLFGANQNCSSQSTLFLLRVKIRAQYAEGASIAPHWDNSDISSVCLLTSQLDIGSFLSALNPLNSILLSQSTANRLQQTLFWCDGQLTGFRSKCNCMGPKTKCLLFFQILNPPRSSGLVLIVPAARALASCGLFVQHNVILHWAVSPPISRKDCLRQAGLSAWKWPRQALLSTFPALSSRCHLLNLDLKMQKPYWVLLWTLCR